MDRRSFGHLLGWGGAALALSGCGSIADRIPGFGGSGPKGGGSDDPADPEALRARVEGVLSEAGVAEILRLTASAQEIGVWDASHHWVWREADGTLMDQGTTSGHDMAAPHLAPLALDAIPFDRLRRAAGTVGDWRVQMVSSRDAGPLIAGPATAFAGEREIQPVDSLLSQDGIATMWDDAVACTGGRIHELFGDPTQVAVTPGPDGAADEDLMSLLVQRWAMPSEDGLLNFDGAPGLASLFVTEKTVQVGPELTGAVLADRVRRMAESRGRVLEEFMNFCLLDVSDAERGIGPTPALMLMLGPAMTENALIIALDEAIFEQDLQRA